MYAVQIVLFFILSFTTFSVSAQTETSAVLSEAKEVAETRNSPYRLFISRSGFMGKGALGLSYEFTPQHAADLSVGIYDIHKVNYYQLNLAYRYAHWTLNYKEHQWRPLQVGLFGVHSLDYDRFFYNSPERYPTKDYYEQTRFRYGFEVGSHFTFLCSKLAIGYHMRIFDTGVIAVVNNENRDLQYYISSGLSLYYIF